MLLQLLSSHESKNGLANSKMCCFFNKMFNMKWLLSPRNQCDTKESGAVALFHLQCTFFSRCALEVPLPLPELRVWCTFVQWLCT